MRVCCGVWHTLDPFSVISFVKTIFQMLLSFAVNIKLTSIFGTSLQTFRFEALKMFSVSKVG